MRFLATSILREPGRIAEIADHRQAEADVVWRLHREGRLREVYLAPDRMLAFILLDAADRAAADAALAALPLTQSGILGWDVVELAALPELAALFVRDGIAPPPWWPDTPGRPASDPVSGTTPRSG